MENFTITNLYTYPNMRCVLVKELWYLQSSFQSLGGVAISTICFPSGKSIIHFESFGHILGSLLKKSGPFFQSFNAKSSSDEAPLDKMSAGIKLD